ncbi:CDP-alcohol phosphatidyltransferase family protein [Candidatus Pacearchaeota archaeon]|nr:CDP-alcohol phosphatidyltransferase family protein [Candidatus Pacearchaeota archaeon]
MKNILKHIPNFLTISRVFLTFVIIYLIFTKADIRTTITIFAIAALTDWLDGQLARKFKWESEFGRKADIIADRFLWVGTALAFIIAFGMSGNLGWIQGMQILFIMSREIITAPFAVAYFMSGKSIPHAAYIGKLTTFVQGFALPALILSIYYLTWTFISIPLSIACLILGSISAKHYIKQTSATKKFNKKKKSTSR